MANDTRWNPQSKRKIRQAYARMQYSDLSMFLRLRDLPVDGKKSDLVDRLTRFDAECYGVSDEEERSEIEEECFMSRSDNKRLLSIRPSPIKPALSQELWILIMDFADDWELATTLRIPALLPMPYEWRHATSLDWAILSGNIQNVASNFKKVGAVFTKCGQNVMIRFGYTVLLDFFFNEAPGFFEAYFPRHTLPHYASALGSVQSLEWWMSSPLEKVYESSAVDSASRAGHMQVLDWWRRSNLPMKYTDSAIEAASTRNHIDVLEWWKSSGLPLKIGRAMDVASTAGNVAVLEWWLCSNLELKYDRGAMIGASGAGHLDVLDWWLNSGLKVICDREALITATKHNRVDVLEWWSQSGLSVEYAICDIEEALEDAMGSAREGKAWWEGKGLDFGANNAEWMESRRLS